MNLAPLFFDLATPKTRQIFPKKNYNSKKTKNCPRISKSSEKLLQCDGVEESLLWNFWEYCPFFQFWLSFCQKKNRAKFKLQKKKKNCIFVLNQIFALNWASKLNQNCRKSRKKANFQENEPILKPLLHSNLHVYFFSFFWQAEIDLDVDQKTHQSHGGSSDTIALQYFSTVNRSRVKLLYARYKLDFLMFNYDPKPYFKVSIKDE